MNISDFVIRPATRTDLADIYDLVCELAIYEREPDAVTALITDYEHAFDDGLIHCVVAEIGGKIVGMTLSFPYFSTWKGLGFYLEDFYIQPDYRRYGLGQVLFNKFLSDARDKGAKLVKWQVLDWNETAVQFYKKNNATIEKDWWNGKIIF